MRGGGSAGSPGGHGGDQTEGGRPSAGCSVTYATASEPEPACGRTALHGHSDSHLVTSVTRVYLLHGRKGEEMKT